MKDSTLPENWWSAWVRNSVWLYGCWHRSCPGNANPRGPEHTGYNGYNECVFMAYIPGCSADVFISYAHRDNLDGWVSKLKDKLVEKLTPFLAGRAEVWFDDRTGETKTRE